MLDYWDRLRLEPATFQIVVQCLIQMRHRVLRQVLFCTRH
jgi:hypothetical protein